MMKSPLDKLSVFAPLLAVLLIYLIHSYSRAVWTDEMFSLIGGAKPPGETLRQLYRYVPGYYDHPPGYFLALYPLMQLTRAAFWLRLPSVIFTLGCIVAVCALRRRRVASNFWAACCALLLGLHPQLAFQACNVRMYAPLLLLTTLALFLDELYVPGPGNRNRYIALLTLLLAAALYLSYFTLIFFGLYLLWQFVELARRRLRPAAIARKGETPGAGLIAAGLALLLFLPWLPAVRNMFVQELQGTHTNIVNSLPAAAQSLLSRYLFLAHDLCGSPAGAGWCLGGAVAAAFIAANDRRLLIRALIFVLMPCTLLPLLAPPHRLISTRYFIYAIPLLLLPALSGWGLLDAQLRRDGRRRASRLLRAAAIAVICANAHALFTTYFKSRPDWWAVARIIEAQARPEEVIMTGGYLSGELLLYHLRDDERFTFAHKVTDLDRFYLHSRMRNVVWFVNAAPLPAAYEKITRRYFPWRAQLQGNDPVKSIQLFCKREFRLPDGSPAPWFEPVELEYEQSTP